MEPEGWLLHSQQPANWPYSAPDKSFPPSYLFKIHISIILSSIPRSSKWSHTFSFPNQNLQAYLVSTNHATCHTHQALKYDVNESGASVV